MLAKSERFGVVFKSVKAMTLALFFSTLRFLCVFLYIFRLQNACYT